MLLLTYGHSSLNKTMQLCTLLFTMMCFQIHEKKWVKEWLVNTEMICIFFAYNNLLAYEQRNGKLDADRFLHVQSVCNVICFIELIKPFPIVLTTSSEKNTSLNRQYSSALCSSHSSNVLSRYTFIKNTLGFSSISNHHFEEKKIEESK